MSTGALVEVYLRFCDSLAFLRGCFLHLPEEFQPQVVYQGLNLVGNFWGDILLDFQEGAAMAPAVFSHQALSGSQQPVGDIDMIQEVLRRDLFLQYVSDGHDEARYCVEALFPFSEAIDIREGCDLALS